MLWFFATNITFVNFITMYRSDMMFQIVFIARPVNMVIWVVEFSIRGLQNWKDLCLKIKVPKRKLLNFENWCNRKVSKRAKIWLSKSIFYTKNHRNLSPFFFIEEYQFKSKFFVSDIFWYHQFLNHFIF